MFLSFSRWLSKAKCQTRKANRPYRRPSFIPQVEPLETRIVPATLSTLTNFTGTGAGTNGGHPDAGLTEDSATGNLFGTTQEGGANGKGTVFELTKSSGYTTENILVNFTGTNGFIPYGDLTEDNSGNLFGTTEVGGANGLGTVFELTKSSGYTSLTTLFSFAPVSQLPPGDSNSTGALPTAALTVDSSTGNLFGTTEVGGTNGYGTVFELTKTSGYTTENILVNFTGTGAGTNGGYPFAALTEDSSGNLFGTTSQGGANGYGTVFELTKSSGYTTENILVNFTGTGAGTNGGYPHAALTVDSSTGNLFGTTLQGGANGYGTVFELTKSSSYTTENILVNFTGTGAGTNGAGPYAAVTEDSSGNLFGTTYQGGANGYGTVFELTKSSGYTTENILVNFTGTGAGTNGAGPYAAVTEDSSGNLFGTTYQGGANGYGTVFELSGTVTLVSGNNQTGAVASPLPAPLVVQVTDAEGNPVSGVTVHWAAIGGGSVSSPTSVTDANGDASMTATLGTIAGSSNNLYIASVSGYSSTATFTESATAAAAKHLILVSGNSQTGTAGSTLPAPLVVEATDQFGNPVSGVTVNWAATSGGGSVRSASSVTGSNGQASVVAVIGGDFTSAYTATVAVLTGSPIAFTESLSSLVVTTTQDENNPNDGTLSLREAIATANSLGGSNTITFAPGLSGTIKLTSNLSSITGGNLTIQGPGAGVLTVSGGNLYSLFDFSGGNTYAISGLTITGGTTGGNGGGVSIGSGDNVTLSNDVIANNSASSGGGIYGVYNYGGMATLSNCTISGNSGGGLDNQGANSSLSLTNCTISGNYGPANGGGLFNSYGTTTLTNCTLSGNTGGYGGGLYNFMGTATLTNCTVSGNCAKYSGGGLFNSYGTATLTNTIVAGNTAGTGPDVQGIFTSLGYNLIGKTDGSSGTTWLSSDLTGTIASPLDPQLGALGNYGGPTQTMSLLYNSPAIDKGSTPGDGVPTTDQRGFARAYGTQTNVDIGAYEGSLALVTDSVSPFTGIINNVAIGSVVPSQTDYVALGSSSGNTFAVALYGTLGNLLASTTTSFAGQSSSYARAAAVFNNNIFVAGTVIVGGVSEFGVAEYSYNAVNGTLNLVTGFNSLGSVPGTVLIPFSSLNGASAFVTGMAISSTGTIGVVGFTANDASYSPPAFAVAELNSSGAVLGQTTTAFFGQGAQARTAIFSGSDLLVAGYAYNPNSPANGNMDFALAEYEYNIAPPSSFGLVTSFGPGGIDTPGTVTTDFGSSSGGASAQAIAIDSKGNIILAGYSIIQDANGDAEFALARYSSSGVLDTTFGSSGIVTTPFGSGNAAAVDGLLIHNGALDAVGYFLSQSPGTFSYQIAVAQYTYTGTGDGTLDTTGFNNFNSALPGATTPDPGMITTPFVTSSGTPLNGWAQAVVAVDSTHFLVAGGTTDSSGDYNLALATYDPPPASTIPPVTNDPLPASTISRYVTNDPLPASTISRYVTKLYEQLLGRVPDPSATYWDGLLKQGVSPADVVQDIESSPEYLDDLVTSYYEKYLQRARIRADFRAGSAFCRTAVRGSRCRKESSARQNIGSCMATATKASWRPSTRMSWGVPWTRKVKRHGYRRWQAVPRGIRSRRGSSHRPNTSKISLNHPISNPSSARPMRGGWPTGSSKCSWA